MKRIYQVYKKTVSIVDETPTAMYESLVGEKKVFCWKAMIRTMNAKLF